MKRIDQRLVLTLTPTNKLQSEVHIWGAAKEDFEVYQGSAQKFPGGYKEMAPFLKEGITYYLVLFAEPGHVTGTTFDLLAYVNDHWCLFLRPWVPCME